ncbi:unnamed protein product, partial [Allacma fusca]
KTFRSKFTKSVANHRLYVQRSAEKSEERNKEIDDVTGIHKCINETTPCLAVSTPRSVEGTEEGLSWGISNIEGLFDIDSLSYIVIESDVDLSNSVSCFQTTSDDTVSSSVQGNSSKNFLDHLNLFEVSKMLNNLYQAQSGDASLDAEIKSLFVETYNHRTIILYDHSFEVLMQLYPCVENTKLIELEATTRYSLEIIMKMKANAKALIKEVQEFYFYTNYPISMQIFFQILNPNGGFFQIFTDPRKFYSDQLESTDLFPYINILLQKKKITGV